MNNQTIAEKETINWRLSGSEVRIAVVELCGWRNAKGSATPMGKRIAATEWDGLSQVARNVLERHGIVNQ